MPKVSRLFFFVCPFFVALEFAALPFQFIGTLLVAFITLLFLLGVFAPQYYDCFIPPENDTEVDNKSIPDGVKAA